MDFDGHGYCGDLAFDFVDCLIAHIEQQHINGVNVQNVHNVQNIHTKQKLQKLQTDVKIGCSFLAAFSWSTIHG